MNDHFPPKSQVVLASLRLPIDLVLKSVTPASPLHTHLAAYPSASKRYHADRPHNMLDHIRWLASKHTYSASKTRTFEKIYRTKERENNTETKDTGYTNKRGRRGGEYGDNREEEKQTLNI